MFSNMKIATRIGLGFACVVLLMLGMGGFTIVQMGKMRENTSDILGNWMPSIRYIEEMNTNTSDFRIAELQHVITERPEEMSRFEKDMSAVLENFARNRDAYVKLIDNPEERAMYEGFAKKWDAYLAAHAKVQELSRALKTQEAMAVLNGDAGRLFDEASSDLLKLVKLNVTGGDAAGLAADQTAVTARSAIITVLLVCMALATLLATLIARNIIKVLGGEPAYVAEIANRVARGDLSIEVNTRPNDNSSALVAMKVMVGRLQQVIEGQREVIAAANRGAFDARVTLTGLQGFQKELGQDLNTLMQTTGDSIADVVHVMGAMAGGDLTQRIDKSYEGAYAQMQEYVNNT